MKNCDSLLCSNKCPKKFSYCKACAKRKGLLDNGRPSLLGMLGFIFFVGIIIKYFFG